MAMIEIRNLTFAYEGSYDNVFENVSFRLDTDWKLGFTGRNGRGKTTFLRLLMGELDSGGAIFSPVPFDYFPFPVHHPEELALEVVPLSFASSGGLGNPAGSLPSPCGCGSPLPALLHPEQRGADQSSCWQVSS